MILVCGVPRSGTTWMGKILSHPANVYYHHEPDNEHHNLLGYVHKQQMPRFPYLTPGDSDNGMFNIYRRVCQGDYIFGYDKSSLLIKKLLGINLESVEEEIIRRTLAMSSAQNPSYDLPISTKAKQIAADQMQRLALKFHKRDLSKKRILVKSVHCILSLAFLHHHFRPKIVIVIRHPANIVSSHRKLDNPDIWRNIFNQKALLQDHFDDYKDEIWQLDNPLEKAGAQVAAFYYVIAKQLQSHPDWIVAKHEEFCLNPVNKFRELFEKLDLQWTEEVQNHISELNKTGEGYDYKRVAEEQIDKWKRRLNPYEIEKIKKGFNIFPQPFYQDFKAPVKA